MDHIENLEDKDIKLPQSVKTYEELEAYIEILRFVFDSRIALKGYYYLMHNHLENTPQEVKE